MIKKIISLFISIYIFCNYLLISLASPILNNTTLLFLSSEKEAQMLSSIIIKKNSIIVIDGGWTYDSDKLYKTIRKYGNKVDAWLITHPDPDHIGALYKIIKDNKDLQINAIYCSFAEDKWYQTYSDDTYEFIKEIKNTLKNKNVISVNKNDTITVKDITINVLNNRYDLHENQHEVINNSSIVYKVNIDNKSILYLGDLGYEGGEKLLNETPPELLKSDIVQMAHHGQSGVSKKVYEIINPKIAIWPTPEWLWTNYDGKGNFKTLETRKWINEIGSISYVTAYGDITLK